MDEPVNQDNLIKVKINSTEPDSIELQGRTQAIIPKLPPATLYDRPFIEDGGTKVISSKDVSPSRKLEPVPLRQL